MKINTILVTGGAGYIGSHACVELLQAGYRVIVLDNFRNSKPSVLRRIEDIAGKSVLCIDRDVRDRAGLEAVFAEQAIDAVIHFAGLKAVGESVADPLLYYENNVFGSLILLQTMAKFGVHAFVFSSSATVYGEPPSVPIREGFPLSPMSPYGRSKMMVEEMLRDLAAADSRWRIALLRYFNPVGAHPSALIGEDCNGIPNNLMPYIAQVAEGRREALSVFGNDYATIDGTGVRDYIHVVDLALGHLKALEKLSTQTGVLTYNLGTGQGYSVLEMIRAFEQASGRPVPYQFAPRRPGDIAIYYADPGLAEQELGWQASRGLAQMCLDAWRWQTSNPHSG